MAKKRRKNLAVLFHGVTIDEEKEKRNKKIPVSKVSKNKCYIDKQQLALQIKLYIESCQDPNKKCIFKAKCKNNPCSGSKCLKRMVRLEEPLHSMIMMMCERIANIWTFRKSILRADFPAHGYATIIARLRKMKSAEYDSAFSYITTVVKNAYRGLNKIEKNQEYMRTVMEIESRKGNKKDNSVSDKN